MRTWQRAEVRQFLQMHVFPLTPYEVELGKSGARSTGGSQIWWRMRRPSHRGQWRQAGLLVQQEMEFFFREHARLPLRSELLRIRLSFESGFKRNVN